MTCLFCAVSSVAVVRYGEPVLRVELKDNYLSSIGAHAVRLCYGANASALLDCIEQETHVIPGFLSGLTLANP